MRVLSFQSTVTYQADRKAHRTDQGDERGIVRSERAATTLNQLKDQGSNADLSRGAHQPRQRVKITMTYDPSSHPAFEEGDIVWLLGLGLAIGDHV